MFLIASRKIWGYQFFHLDYFNAIVIAIVARRLLAGCIQAQLYQFVVGVTYIILVAISQHIVATLRCIFIRFLLHSMQCLDSISLRCLLKFDPITLMLAHTCCRISCVHFSLLSHYQSHTQLLQDSSFLITFHLIVTQTLCTEEFCKNYQL